MIFAIRRIFRERVLVLLVLGAGIMSAIPLWCEYADTARHESGVSSAPSPSDDAAFSPEEWGRIETRFAYVYYRRSLDLRRLERRLRQRTFFGSQTGGELTDRIGYRIDALAGFVEDALDMHPAMPKITIKICADQDELNTEYEKLFGVREELESFYIHKLETIYTSADNISDSIIAHEMAHAVIDHYFSTIPPKKVAEVLASYVDNHLED